MAHYAPRLRPLGIGDLLDETIRLYRRNFLLFIGIGAVLMIPIGLLQLAATLMAYSGRSMGLGLGLSALSGVLSWLSYTAIMLAVTCAVSEIHLGRQPTVGSAYAAGLRRFKAALGLYLLVILAFVFPGFLFTILSAFLASLAGALLGGLLLLVVFVAFFAVCVYFGISWSVSTQAMLLENLGISRALGRSRALVGGHWWKAFAFFLLLIIIQFMFQLVFSLLGGVLGAPLLLLPGVSTFAKTSIISTIVTAISGIGATPILFCGLALLYYDLRIRKEGFDLELLAREMEGGNRPFGTEG